MDRTIGSFVNLLALPGVAFPRPTHPCPRPAALPLAGLGSLAQASLELLTQVGGPGGDGEDAPQGFRWRVVVEDQTEHRRNRNSVFVGMDPLDGIAGADDALLGDGEVHSRPARREEFPDHHRIAEPDVQLETGHPGLGHDQPRGADAKLIANVNRVFDEALRGEILPKEPYGSSRPSCDCQSE